MKRELTDKVAVVYGAGGAVGGAIARAFAREGARVYASGRTLESAQKVVEEIIAAGGTAEAAQVDALDEQAVDRHAAGVAEDMTLLKRLPTLDEVANTAVFLASDDARSMTGVVADLTAGMSVD